MQWVRRTAAVGLRYFMDVIPILVLYNPNRPADRFRPRRKIKFGLLDLSARFVVVRLWRLDPSDILKHRRIHLMPMVAAMKSTPAQIHEAAMRIEQLKNPDERKRLRQEMATFAAVRYNEDEANELIGRQLNMMPPLEVVRDSDIGRKIERIGRFQGLERGRREGERKGVIKGRRAFLFEALREKFPSLEISEADLPTDDEALKRLMQEMVHTSDTAKMRRLIAASKG
jgi:predicted transposase YdaD